MLELYKNIKKYRKELGLTQQALAERTGYKDKSMIAKIEKGLVDLPQSKIKLFAKTLGVTPSELMGSADFDPELTRKTIDLLSGRKSFSSLMRDMCRDELIAGECSIEDLPYVYFVHRDGSEETFGATTFVYSIVEAVSKMPPEQQELVNNMVGGKKIIYVENPQNRKPTKEVQPHLRPNAAHTRTDKPITDADLKHDDDIMDDEDF